MINELTNAAPSLPDSDILVAMFFFAATAIVIALAIPGFLLPIAASSGALLDTLWGSTSVASGALAGSMAIFVATRHFGNDRMPAKITGFLRRFERQLQTHGAWWVLVLRLVGAPHFLVSAGSALVPIRARYFALATAIGMVPAILLAAALGSTAMQ